MMGRSVGTSSVAEGLVALDEMVFEAEDCLVELIEIPLECRSSHRDGFISKEDLLDRVQVLEEKKIDFEDAVQLFLGNFGRIKETTEAIGSVPDRIGEGIESLGTRFDFIDLSIVRTFCELGQEIDDAAAYPGQPAQ